MTDPPLRLIQRDDGLGPAAHARLQTQAQTGNQSSSTQQGTAPRIGTNGRYS